ncbi:alkaline phosphatase family protein [Candidatus Poribacteria bacterium]
MNNHINHSPASKVLAIGLDGMPPHLLRWLVAEGYMPNVARLMDEGIYGPLRSTIPPITPTAWTSFMTGKNPGRHGIYGFLRFFPDNPTEVSLANSQSIAGSTLPDILSQNGKKVGFINLPMTYPPRPVNGFMITGLMTPSTDSSFTYPEDLRNELLEEFPDYDFLVRFELFDVKTDRGFNDFIDMAIRVITVRANACEYLMGKYQWDFLMVHFQSVDGLQHKLWSYIDPDLDLHIDKWRRDRIIEFYKALDTLIGQILLCAKHDDMVTMIMSDHGFGSVKGEIHPNLLLKDWGFLQKSKKATGSALHTANRIKNSLRRVPLLAPVCRAVKNSVRSSARKTWLEYLEEQQNSFGFGEDFNWEKTSAYFMVRGSYYGNLYINRNSHANALGMSSETEYSILRESLIQRLRRIESPATGEPVFKQVLKSESIYSGEFLNQAPDLVVVPREGYAISDSLLSASFVEESRMRIWGDHREDGIFIVTGNGIKANVPLAGAGIMDIAPTILYCLGLPIPEDMDGDVLTSVFQEAYIDNNPVEYCEADETCAIKLKSEVYSSDEQGMVSERLEGLGYL